MDHVKTLNILLVEDDPGHARLVERNLRRANITSAISQFNNGQELIDYLSEKRDAGSIALKESWLILLDLNMPLMDGYDVLRYLKAEPRLKHIPVIVLTTTYDPREITRCYELGCNVYITKPVDYEQFSEAINRLGQFLSIITIPDSA